MNCTSIRHDELFSVRYPVSAHQRGQTKDRHKPKIVLHSLSFTLIKCKRH